ncbi:MAG: hypothetical protein LUQ25_03170 [Methanoregulaceae archaeon]|nr:hypothetical protein [Methanoregulaceae archaeon]
MAERPMGVTIIGILWIIAGLLWIFAGIVGGAVLAVIGLGAIGAALGVIFFVIGIIDILLGIGCFMGWGWVWTIGVIFMILNLIIGLISLFGSPVTGVITIIIAIIVLWYLFQPNVKAYFGKT